MTTKVCRGLFPDRLVYIMPQIVGYVKRVVRNRGVFGGRLVVRWQLDDGEMAGGGGSGYIVKSLGILFTRGGEKVDSAR